MRKVGLQFDLVDKPNERKHHKGIVPLVGGISISFTLILYLIMNPNLLEHSGLFIFSIGLLTLIGVIDDKVDISYKLRILIQVFLSIVMIFGADLTLNSLGNLFGFGVVELGFFGWIVTILAVLGMINAINMVDGIDGLLGGLSLVTFLSLYILLSLSNHFLAPFCLLISIVMIPYILMNLGLFGKKRKVFMGDAGSMVIGFCIIWLLISVSQPYEYAAMHPVTALWFIAIPLMDMASLILYRLQMNQSPFHPDREHLHHVMQRNGLNRVQTLLAICSLAIIFSSIGLFGDIYQVPEYIMFYGFLMSFIFYNLLLRFLRQRIEKKEAFDSSLVSFSSQ